MLKFSSWKYYLFFFCKLNITFKINSNIILSKILLIFSITFPPPTKWSCNFCSMTFFFWILLLSKTGYLSFQPKIYISFDFFTQDFEKVLILIFFYFILNIFSVLLYRTFILFFFLFFQQVVPLTKQKKKLKRKTDFNHNFQFDFTVSYQYLLR